MVAMKEKPSNKVTNEPGGEAEREEDEIEEEIALAGTVEADCLSGLSEDGTMAGDQHLPTLTEGLGEVRESPDCRRKTIACLSGGEKV